MCVCVDKHLVDCGNLKTKVRVIFIFLTKLWGPKTKHLHCGDLKNTFKQRPVPTNYQKYELSQRFFVHRFVVAMMYYGVFLSAPTVGGDMYLNFFLSSLVELPAIYLGIKAFNRYVKHTRETRWWLVGPYHKSRPYTREIPFYITVKLQTQGLCEYFYTWVLVHGDPYTQVCST